MKFATIALLATAVTAEDGVTCNPNGDSNWVLDDVTYSGVTNHDDCFTDTYNALLNDFDKYSCVMSVDQLEDTGTSTAASYTCQVY